MTKSNPRKPVEGSPSHGGPVQIAMPVQIEEEAEIQPNESNETPVVMTTSFICQQLDLGINDIMYQVSQQLADIVKPMVHNEVQQAREMETKRAHSGESSINSAIPTQAGYSNQAGPVIPPNAAPVGPVQAQPSTAPAGIQQVQPTYV